MLEIPAKAGEMIREARRKLGLSQAGLGRILGRERQRISSLERGVRLPDEHEQALLSKHLDLDTEKLRLACVALPVGGPSNLRRRFRGRDREHFYPHQDRPTSVRLGAAWARSRNLMTTLMKRLGRRHDREQVGVFLRDASFDSDSELFASLSLLAEGSEPILAAPTDWGFEQLALVNPKDHFLVGHRKSPALVHRACEMIIFPQMTFLAGKRAPRVDLLVGRYRKGQAIWYVVEIDGEGHRFDYKELLIPLPFVRFGPDEVLAPNFLARVAASCPGHA